MTHRLVLLYLLAACQEGAHDRPAPPTSQKGQKRSETLVYVDGTPRASLSFGELPSGGGPLTLCEYLAAVGEGGYALADFLRQQHLGQARAVELVTSDDRVVAVPDAAVAGIHFAAEPEKHGQMSFRFAGRAVAAVAVNVYVSSRPPARQLAPAKSVVARQAGFSAGCSSVAAAPWVAPSGLFFVVVALLATAWRRW